MQGTFFDFEVFLPYFGKIIYCICLFIRSLYLKIISLLFIFGTCGSYVLSPEPGRLFQLVTDLVSLELGG